MNYYPFHIGDYLSATRHLSWEEDCAYRRLLDTYYTNEKPLPLEAKQVWRLVLATTEVQREAVETVLAEFFERTDAGWINSRADAEIEAMREKQQKQRDKANKRWQKPEPEPGIADAMPQHPSEDATASKGDAVAMPPTPTPTPTPPIERDASVARSSSRAKKPDSTLATYLDVCKAAGKKPLPPDHSIRAYCTDAGISDEMLQVAWIVFRDDYVSGKNKDKRQKDWPAHFANSVKRRWYQLWYSGDDGVAAWTSTGLQEKQVIDARHRAKEQQHEPA